jgi:hypothetical protein
MDIMADNIGQQFQLPRNGISSPILVKEEEKEEAAKFIQP